MLPVVHALQAGNTQAHHQAHHVQPVNVLVQSLVNVLYTLKNIPQFPPPHPQALVPQAQPVQPVADTVHVKLNSKQANRMNHQFHQAHHQAQAAAHQDQAEPAHPQDQGIDRY